MNNNGNRKTWGAVREVSRALMDNRPSIYTPLFADLLLRLEATSSSHCLCVPFDTMQDAQSARSSLRKMFSKSKPREVSIVLREIDEQSCVIVGWSAHRRNINKGKARLGRKSSKDFDE